VCVPIPLHCLLWLVASIASRQPIRSLNSSSLPPSLPPSLLPPDHWGIEAGLSTSGSSSSNLRRSSYQYGGSGGSPSPSITNKQVLFGFIALGLIFCKWEGGDEGREGGREGGREEGSEKLEENLYSRSLLYVRPRLSRLSRHRRLSSLPPSHPRSAPLPLLQLQPERREQHRPSAAAL